MTYCHACGAALVPDAAFCSRCGTRVASMDAGEAGSLIPTATSTTTATSNADAGPEPSIPAHVVAPVPPAAAPRPRSAPRQRWWIVPAVVVGLILAASLLLMAMPFGREDRAEVPPVASEPIAESTPATDTIVEITPSQPTAGVALQPNIEPNIETPAADAPASIATTAPPEPKQTPPPSEPLPEEPVNNPETLARNDAGELTAPAATAALLGYVRRNNYYAVDPECVRAVNLGYENEGYTLEIWRDCGEERRLDRWRVDSRTAEVFRQREDGRFLSP